MPEYAFQRLWYGHVADAGCRIDIGRGAALDPLGAGGAEHDLPSEPVELRPRRRARQIDIRAETQRIDRSAGHALDVGNGREADQRNARFAMIR